MSQPGHHSVSSPVQLLNSQQLSETNFNPVQTPFQQSRTAGCPADMDGLLSGSLQSGGEVRCSPGSFGHEIQKESDAVVLEQDDLPRLGWRRARNSSGRS